MSQMKKDEIAVIILTHNRYKEFQLSINSVLKQKNIKLRIFIFDNASEKSLETVIPKDKNITYVRHKKNIGFANNFRYATQYVKNLSFHYSFLLSDDDLLSYPTVIADLFELMQTDPDVHIVRGGFATFVDSVKNVTQIYTYNQKQINALAHLSELNRAFPFHVDFYSGQLYKNDLFEPNTSPYNDLVTPFLAPLLKILIKKKILFLPDKIILFAKTEHNQLALNIYDEAVSSSEGLEKSFSLIGKKFRNKTNPLELINYKIYSHHPKLIKKYFDQCLQDKAANKLLNTIIYITPKIILRHIKITSKKISAVLLKRRLKSHAYLDF